MQSPQNDLREYSLKMLSNHLLFKLYSKMKITKKIINNDYQYSDPR